MKIVIDLQGAQSTGSRNRGIGRYSLSLALAIIKNRGGHEVTIALNGLFPETISPIKESFDGLLPPENIVVWQTPADVAFHSEGSLWNRQTAEHIREAFLANLKPDLILITSLLEGLGDDAVTSIGLFNHTVPTIAILYDLIPHIYRDIYLSNPIVEQWYDNKIAHLCRADLLLSISESSRQEGINYLDIPADNIVNISTAADAQFVKIPLTDSEKSELLQRYDIKTEYIMYTGGIDHRKNIEGLIRAYACLPSTLRDQYQLAVVCSIQSTDRTRLEALIKDSALQPEDVILTGFIPEDDLIKLYNLCDVFVFPSKHEGFGLPVLEAMHCGSPVIGSRTSSLPEVIGYDDALFDPYDDASITKKLEQVLTDSDFKKELTEHSAVQSKVFSWDRSAKLSIAAFEKFLADKSVDKVIIPHTVTRPRLAFISPLPSERSGISDYSAQLLPALALHYQIDIITTQSNISGSYINTNFHIRNPEWFVKHHDVYDRVLYHFGNSQFHQHMFDLIEQVPGVIVLHDFYLSGLITYMDAHGYSPNFLASQLYKSHGYNAIQRCCSSANISDVVSKYPANLNVLHNAQGVIIHSETSRNLAKSWYGAAAGNDWVNVPLLRKRVHDIDKQKSRAALGIPKDTFVICSFGILAVSKLNHRLLDALVKSKLLNDKHYQLVFVGQNDGAEYGERLLKTIHSDDLNEKVTITGWTDTQTFNQYLAAADIGVQLRGQSRGETSAAVLDCMNFGLPTIVNTNGSLKELPDDTVLKIPDNFNDDDLIAALESLWSNEAQRTLIAKKSKTLIHEQHSPRHCAQLYFNAIEQFSRDAMIAAPALIKSITQLESTPATEGLWKKVAQDIDKAIPLNIVQQQLLIDVSGLIETEKKHPLLQSLQKWLIEPITSHRVEPIYLPNDKDGYRYARDFSLVLLDCPKSILPDEPISYKSGDILLELKLTNNENSVKKDAYQEIAAAGITIASFESILDITLDESIQHIIEKLEKQFSLASQNDNLC
jgi:glycosyltransferase involved in cell wall biosynthesis